MFETVSPFFKNRAIYLFIFGAILFFLIFFGYRFVLPETAGRVSVGVGISEGLVERRVEFTVPEFDVETYYRPIIKNNLFRPLGWVPPRPIEPYRLIGTILPRDANTPLKAIIETTAGHQTYIVTAGDKLDADTEVVAIASKQVTLQRNQAKCYLFLCLIFTVN